ncbi:MAG: protoheme IX farnesyltransferase [Candidatus Eremiobacter antarcticus]|nr:protoheme IX farnesyltransferase [Candidatus Eremiobacteraeota bacterium]MBC5807249.1 protoheme IX farnesyltransferase [Candidatus Eremiobacteraeota bacterium]PZR61940.1 MAG: protoheme IX farnesyltransferase [Candidatus Eremiobacter sp. RRmetagenome_bin22]
METARSHPFRALKTSSLLAAAFAYALVIWGAVVRINGAGMTCPDWPRCRGVWLPDLSGSVVYEFAHRAGAPILTLLIVVTCFLAYRSRRVIPQALPFAWAAIGLIVVQIILGGLTIRFGNSAPSVASHLLVGASTFTVLALLAYSVFSAGRQRPAVDDPAYLGLGRLALLAMLSAFAAIFAGGFMSASHAGLACRGFPLCDGWSGGHTAAQMIHMGHRFAAYATLLIVLTLAVRAFAAVGVERLRTTIGIIAALAVVQICLGALTVMSGLLPLLRVVHQANGVLLAAMLALLSYVALASRAVASDARRSATLEISPAGAAASRASRPEPQASARAQPGARIRDYIALTKPNVMSLLLFTTLTAMMIAAGGFPSPALVFWTLLGGALASASSGSINMYLDADIDAQMSRTRLRPIPSGRVRPVDALRFGVVLGIAAFVELWFSVNWLAALLSSAGILYYVLVYTMWLKRTTPQNIVIGGAAGSIPPLVGWAAVTHRLDLTAVLLFFIVFVWTPPHFWCLALMKKEEYARVGIPMLPAVRGEAVTKRHIIWYTIALTALTVVMVPLHLMGVTYLVCALVLDALFLAGAVWVAAVSTKKSQGLMYRFSMLYLALLFTAMVIDRFGRGGA